MGSYYYETLSKVSVEFEPGQVVRLRSNPGMRGAVLSVITAAPEHRIKVFVDGATQDFYASQLQVDDGQGDGAAAVPCDQFHAHLTALQIRHPGLSTLYSLHAARVDYIPYQFRPVLRFIRSDRPRLLIADGVGVGKTIEAGLILRELQARRDVQSVLIICPRPLVTERKWQSEMKRFDERFTHLDGAILRYCIDEMTKDGAWPEQHRKTIIPYSLFDESTFQGMEATGKRRRRPGLFDLDPPPRFDLVIVDEAHHIRNQDTWRHKAVRFFCEHAEAVVFLTATPIQLGSRDLFVLLNTLRPDLIIDEGSFAHMTEPNPFINQAVAFARAQEPEWAAQADVALGQAAATAWGQSILQHNPDYSRTRALLTQGATITHEQRIQLIADMESLHTLSGIVNRTRRRDIGEFTVRKPETVTVPFTPCQQSLHDEVLRVQADVLSRLHGNQAVAFMMTTIRRQTASCLFGLVPFLEDILRRHLDELAWEEADSFGAIPDEKAVGLVEMQVHAILERVRSLDPFDPKLDALRKIVRNKQVLPNNKVMLFSSFRHTLGYLHANLRADGVRVGLVHGATPDEERMLLRGRFALPRENADALDLLLFSEIGCEGLDYQFCDCIVNYDLPWNPMRIEQRIGRVDRRGQKSPSVAIFNLITPGTVDADIYERCLLRIGIFNNALGGSEEILGEITQEIHDIAARFTLSEQDRQARLDQLADNKIRHMREQEVLEQRQLELFGIRLPQEQMEKEVKDASSYWLSPASLRRLVLRYLEQRCGKEQESLLGDKPLKTLRIAQEVRSALLRDFQELPRQTTSAYRDWEAWLKGASPHLAVTFDSECASQQTEAAFVMPLHPLVRQAALAVDIRRKVHTRLKVQAANVPPGRYDFAVYQWRYHGLRENLVLQPVASSQCVATHLTRLLQEAEDATMDADGSAAAEFDALDAQHYALWAQAHDEHRRRTREQVAFRRESLTTSHKARMALLNEQLRAATDDGIRNMRRGQQATAESDYSRHLQELDIAVERADLTSSPVAYGTLSVESKQ